MSEHARALSLWVDDSPMNEGRSPEEMIWQRCAKVAEESGEVVAALIGATGSNPRKGLTHTRDDVEKELLDVVACALGAVEHLRGNDGSSSRRLADHLAYLCERVGLTVPVTEAAVAEARKAAWDEGFARGRKWVLPMDPTNPYGADAQGSTPPPADEGLAHLQAALATATTQFQTAARQSALSDKRAREAEAERDGLAAGEARVRALRDEHARECNTGPCAYGEGLRDAVAALDEPSRTPEPDRTEPDESGAAAAYYDGPCGRCYWGNTDRVCSCPTACVSAVCLPLRHSDEAS